MKLVSLLALIALLVWIFVKARRQAEQSPQRRRFIIWRAIVIIPVGLVIALVLPQRVPMNNESPAGIVVYLVGWVIGGLLALQGITSLAAALIARPSVDGRAVSGPKLS
jgi:hypothetical protein